MALYDNYNLRFNTANATLEMNTGAETWVPVPIPAGDIGLADGKILVGDASSTAVGVTMTGAGSLSNTGVLSLTATSVTGALLTGYVSGAGTVASTDTILQGINKLNGNDALKLPLAGGTLTGDLAITKASGDAAITMTAGSELVTIAKASTGNKVFYIQNNGQTGFIFDQNGGTVSTGAMAFNNTTPIRTSSVMSAGTLSPNAASVLQADSTTQGFLEPRMTTAQRDAISTPPEGLQVYNTDTHLMNVRNDSTWVALGSASPAGADTQIQFNDSTAFGASANLTWSNSVATLSIGNTGVAGPTYLNILDPNAQSAQINIGSASHARTINFTNADATIQLSSITGVTDSSIAIDTDGGEFSFAADGGLVLPNLAADPGSPVEGEVWYNATSHLLKFYDGTNVKTVLTA